MKGIDVHMRADVLVYCCIFKMDFMFHTFLAVHISSHNSLSDDAGVDDVCSDSEKC